jgi:hypothetical protein
VKNDGIVRAAVIATTALLCACSGSATGSIPAASGGALATLSDGRQNLVASAVPASLSLAASASATFVVTVKSGHALTATSADPTCAIVSPASQKPANDGNGKGDGGDTKSGTFTVTAAVTTTANCSTTITVTGNDQETVVVPVTISAAVKGALL